MKGKIPRLEVRWYDGRLVGHVLVPGETLFAYCPEWLATGHDLSPRHVPFDDKARQYRADGFDHLPGFLADCLPDQWGDRLMQAWFAEAGVHNPSPMQQLAWVGCRGIGALRFEPEAAASASASWAHVKPALLLREVEAVLRSEPSEAFSELVKTGTAGGAYPKATVAQLPDGTLLHGGNVAVAIRDHPEAKLGLLKLDCSDLPGFAGVDGRMEHAYLKMAQAAGIHCASSQIIPTDGEIHPRHHLFVERFDVDRGTGRRHHLVTLAGMAHAFRLTYESLLELTLKITQDHGQVREAVRRMIFNVRAGNADDHGKNHSFLYDEDRRQWRLSPAYDITLSYERDRSLSGLFPATFGNQPRGVALQKQAVAAGLSEAEFAGIDEQVRSACNRWPEFADQAGVSAAEKARAAAAIAELGKSIDGVPLPTGMGPRARSSRRRLF